MSSFESLLLIEPLLSAVREQGYATPTPIQLKAIPPLLEGRDVLGCAQTGTGKTAAFALPILQHLARRPAPGGRRKIRALVLSPTRELAAQIGESFEAYARFLPALTHTVIFGGVNATPQISRLRAGFDVLVATPGRLLDLHGQGEVDLGGVEFFVLDEADRMLDMGFIHDVRRVLRALPAKKQNLLFSATMPPDIVNLAGDFLHAPVSVEVTPESTTAERIAQRVMFVEQTDKRHLLAHLLSQPEVRQSIVFTRTKHGANRLVQQLERDGHAAAAIHGNKSQNARERALDGFRAGTLPTLVATDIAARGIDVPGVSHVFNYDLPNEPESYVHRIGRTGRAGESGLAVAFCDATEGAYLRDIERLIGMSIEVDAQHAWHCPAAVPPPLRHTGARREPAPAGARPPQGRPAPGRPAQDRPREGAPAPAPREPRAPQGAPRPQPQPRPPAPPQPRPPAPPQPRPQPAPRPPAPGGGQGGERPEGAPRRRRRGGAGRGPQG
ncbi:MAG: DEAD/DEAH box helicase [Deltaproteobacteria bacterium]|nr:DEAD/DEAH box helicase [Deltaproteobacteria bacterium]